MEKTRADHKIINLSWPPGGQSLRLHPTAHHQEKQRVEEEEGVNVGSLELQKVNHEPDSEEALNEDRPRYCTPKE